MVAQYMLWRYNVHVSSLGDIRLTNPNSNT